ncbi:MAG: aminotransferase class I/II-fold pyridoxal phosphate-dependent enzyme, partial [Ruminococcus sp.]|nr:aminotransferase class I/II-fold pyridoxal phosphate-dependent enzyme [Ruminococcus sp.]
AQCGGIAALDEKDYLLTTVEFVRKEREFLTTELSDMKLKVFESEANFIFFRSSLPLDILLEKEKILIRNCNNYSGLGNGFFRVAVKTHEENIIFVSALRRVLNG